MTELNVFDKMLHITYYSERDLIEKYTNKTFLVKEHDQLISNIERRNLFHKVLSKTNMNVLSTNWTHLEHAVVPSACSVQLLPENRVGIFDLMHCVDKHIDGKFFLCRTISPATMMVATMTVVDDPEGELAVRFSIYNLFSPQQKEKLDELLPVGTIMAVKNPYFKTTRDKCFSLRTDDPRDVIFLNEFQCQELFPFLKWKSDIPKEYKHLAIKFMPKTTEEWKILGNSYFLEKNFNFALNAYTAGLSKDPQSVVLLSNRAAIYLQLQAYQSALSDANEILQIEPFHAKAIYRKGRALCGLKKYEDALVLLDSLKASSFKESDLTQLMKLKSNVKLFLHQKKTGDYDILFMLRKSNDATHTFDYADYTGPVEIRESPGKGRGLFATDDIKPGQLLIGCKAFALRPYENVLDRLNSAEMAAIVARILSMAPERGEEFYQLYAGPELGFLSSEKGECNRRVDINRIMNICEFNAFEIQETVSRRKSCEGIWLLPSFINHSCLHLNCWWMVFGDFMLIRAVKPIAKNEEILITYVAPSSSFQERNVIFKKHNFVCDCRLCEIERNESKEKQDKKREVLNGFLETFKSLLGQMRNIRELNKYVKQLSYLGKSYPELNFNLITPLMVLGRAYGLQNQFAKADEAIEKMCKLAQDCFMWDSILVGVNDIVRSYQMAGIVGNAEKWIKKLRETSLLVYGTTEVDSVLEFLFKKKTSYSVFL